MKRVKKKIGVIDFETDPFLFGRIPKPFAWGFYDGTVYKEFWQKDAWNSNTCAEKLAAYIRDAGQDDEPLLVYAHNGGKFDFLFIIEWLEGEIKIVNGRIMQANIGNCVLRDSYGILPIPLSKLQKKENGVLVGKLEIDYSKMERDVREKHKKEILTYLRADCHALYAAVVAFVEEFGDVLTIGSASMRELKKFHKFTPATESFDKVFRNYYFGGRCQCFEMGIIKAPKGKTFKGYDSNAAYPDAMRRMRHPVSTDHTFTRKVTKDSAFVCWQGNNDNAVPVREKTGLNFASESGTYWSTIHEFNMALDIGIIEPKRIIHAVEFSEYMIFDEFIDHFHGARLVAIENDDLFKSIFYKLVENSAYGKFAQSPENFQDSIILPWGETAPEPYMPQFVHGEYAIWSKPALSKTYFNVATAASITGGARANLMRGLADSIRPLYCDTDSIYCEEFNGTIHQTELGKWKLEFEADQIAIAGKKLYAAMGYKKNKETGILEYGCVKQASKGVRLNHEQIFHIANGGTVETRNDAPSFKLDGKHIFIERTIRHTGQQKAAQL